MTKGGATAAPGSFAGMLGVVSGAVRSPDAPPPLDEAPCANCGSGPVAAYCAACGQRRMTEHDLTLAGFFHDSWHELTSLDGRLFSTLHALITKPGLLAKEYFAGRGSRYMKPLSLFVLMNLVFFIIQPHTGLMRYSLANYIDFDGDVAGRRRDLVNATRVDLAMESAERRRAAGYGNAVATVETMPVFRVRFDDTLQDLKKSMLIVSIPLLAVAMGLLYMRSTHRFAEHLVFSVHTYAFFLLFSGVFITPAFIAAFWLMSRLHVPASVIAALQTEPALLGVMLVAMVTYLFLGLRRMYRDGIVSAAVRAVSLFVVMFMLILVYHDALFWATLASL